MGDITIVEWVQKNSPYKQNVLLLHLLLAREIGESSQDHIVAARNYLAAKIHCSVDTVRVAEAQMVKDGYLDIRRTFRYGNSAHEYRLLLGTVTGHAIVGNSIVEEFIVDGLIDDDSETHAAS